MPRTASRESAPAAAAQQATAIPSVAALKQAAHRVADFFAVKKGLRLKHSDALELVAVVHGARNWQTLQGIAQANGAGVAAEARPAAWTGHTVTQGDDDALHEWLAHQLASNIYACRGSLTVVESAEELEAIERHLGKRAFHLLPLSQLTKSVGHYSVPAGREELMSLAKDVTYEGQWVVSLAGAGADARMAAQEALDFLYGAIYQLRRENASLQFTRFTVTSHSGEGLQPIFEQGRAVNMCAVALYGVRQRLHQCQLDNARNTTIVRRHGAAKPGQLG